MPGKILISTSSLRRWKLSLNEQIDLCHNLDIDGIEISFQSKDEFLNFNLTYKNMKTLNRFKFNTIHLPFENITYNKQQKELIDKLNLLNKKIRPKFIVAHSNNVLDYSIFNGINLAIENYGFTRKQFIFYHSKQIFNMILKGILNTKIKLSIKDQNKKLHLDLKNNKDLKLILDTSHASSISETEIENLINLYKDKIIGIHLSAFCNYKNHVSLNKTDNSTLKNLAVIKTLNVPLILEQKFPYRNSESIRQEITFLKKWYKS